MIAVSMLFRLPGRGIEAYRILGKLTRTDIVLEGPGGTRVSFEWDGPYEVVASTSGPVITVAGHLFRPSALSIRAT